ncbi:MAG: hypothetical protein D6B27_04560 [Gammaproteobacteria bacterium]|nr:MAG: hypothetical protein D6B27_04560 [Gammaproteobacteria bacterium]
MSLKISPFFCAFLLSGCIFSAPKRDIPNIGGVKGAQETATLVIKNWWQVFGSEKLNSSIATALQKSPAVMQASAKVRQQKALLISAEGVKDISADLNSSASLQKSDNPSSESYSLSLSAGYNVDIADVNGAAIAIAKSNLQSAELSLFETRQNVSNSLVKEWIKLQALYDQEPMLLNRLELANKRLEILQLRFDAGIVSIDDLLEQQQTVLQLRDSVKTLHSNIRNSNYNLIQISGGIADRDSKFDDEMLPLGFSIQAEKPLRELLGQRTDILSAWVQVNSSDWAVVKAERSRYPSISLKSTFSLTGETPSKIFDNWLLSLVGSLVQPLLDGDSRKAEVVRSKALADQNLWKYRETVVAAISALSQLLNEENRIADSISLLKKHKNALEKQFSQAKSKYKNGSGDYLSWVTIEDAIVQKQIELLSKNRDLLLVRVNIIEETGGNPSLIREK